MAQEFNFQIKGQPDFSYLEVDLTANQRIRAEASAMISMDKNIAMETKFRGGFRRFLGGESLFINEYESQHFPGKLTLAGGMPGDISHVHLEQSTLFVQSGGFLASGMGVNVETKWEGMVKGFFSGAGLFLLKCSGKGDVFLATFGGIVPIEIDGEHVVDTNHIVAFTEGLTYKISKIGGYKSLFFSGEGFVARFQGKGRLWIQSHQYPAFSRWVSPFRPSSSSDGGDGGGGD